MLKLSATGPNLCPYPDQSFDQWPPGMIERDQADVALTDRHLAQAFDKPSYVALPRFCRPNLHTKVWNIMKYGVSRQSRSTIVHAQSASAL